MIMTITERRAEFVYNAARLAGVAAGAPIIPDLWSEREDSFKKQFFDPFNHWLQQRLFRSLTECFRIHNHLIF